MPCHPPLREAPAAHFRVFGTLDLPEQWRAMILQAEKEVCITAFTFDSELVCESLIGARRRRGRNIPRCRILMDGAYADRGNMANRAPRLERLRSHGVLVRLFRAGRRLHQKSLLADQRLYTGSMNFSQASFSNVERGAILELSPADYEAELQEFNGAWGQGVDE